MTHLDVIRELKSIRNMERATFLMGFFKTGKGGYAADDLFWGINVPDTRKIAGQYKALSLDEVEELLHNEVHEVRLCALAILVHQYKKNPDAVYKVYMRNLKWVNNWDLVDMSAPKIVGPYCYDHGYDVLYKLARSTKLWEKRVAMVSTMFITHKGNYDVSFDIAEILLHDSHDLIHKAVGWMLRDVGKYCSSDVLDQFLEKHAHDMPRTALRYAIEHYSPKKRQYYLGLKKSS